MQAWFPTELVSAAALGSKHEEFPQSEEPTFLCFPLDGRREATSCKSFGVQFKCSVDALMLQSPKPWDGCTVMTLVRAAATALQSYVEVFK